VSVHHNNVIKTINPFYFDLNSIILKNKLNILVLIGQIFQYVEIMNYYNIKKKKKKIKKKKKKKKKRTGEFLTVLIKKELSKIFL